MSFRGRKTIIDPWGNYLFGLRKRMLAFRSTFIGEDQNGNELFELKNRMSCEPHQLFPSTSPILLREGLCARRSAEPAPSP